MTTRRSFLKKIALVPVMAAISTDLVFGAIKKESWYEQQTKREFEKMACEFIKMYEDLIIYGSSKFRVLKDKSWEHVPMGITNYIEP